VLRNVGVAETWLVCATVQLEHPSPTCDCFSQAALLLQPFVQDHSANQPHTARYKHTGEKMKLSPSLALRPRRLTPRPPA